LPIKKPKPSEFDKICAELGGVTPKIPRLEVSESLDELPRIRKHYLVFTEAGKPVYTRHGDEMNLAPFFATISAIFPKIQSYYWSTEQDARLNRN
jgi:hypothetical protein